MWRDLRSVLVTGAVGAALLAGSVTSSEAVTPPVRSAASVAGPAPADQVYYRRYYRGYYYDRTGAAVAGAALGLIGLAATAAIASRSYDDPYYYGGYYPAYYGAYPAYYGYYGGPYWGYRRAFYARPYWGYRRAFYARPYGWGGYRRAYFAPGWRGGYGYRVGWGRRWR